MADRTPTADDRLAKARRRVRAQARRSRLALAAERAARAFWPLWAVIAAFLGAALLGLPQQLTFWGHVAALAAFAAAALAALWRGARAFRWPTDAEARARLDAETADRPVAAMEDALASNAADAGTQGIWAVHRARMAERAAAARAAPADLRVSDRDRFALRHAALLALAAGVIAQLGDGGTRLAEALTPGATPAAAAGATGPTLEAWASPPVHTGAPPIYLTERPTDAQIALPAGSEITLRVFDADAPPALVADIAEPAAFEAAGTGVWGVTVRLARDGTLAAEAEGETLGGWALSVIPDAPPTIAFTAEPTAQRSGALGFAFETADDYGVVSARAEIRLDESLTEFAGFPRRSVYDVVSFELPLPLTGDAESAAEEVVEDLTPHPFAGLPVVITLIAEDGAGQEGRAEARVTMPERRFFEPLAKAIIEQRRIFAWSLDSADRVARVLDAVTDYPDDIFDDMTAYLTLRTAMRRLENAQAEERLEDEAEGIVDLLWDVAIRIEDGDLSAAERRLRELQERLSEALEEGALEDEIAQLMDELRQALNEYLQQLAQEALRDQANGQQQQQQPIDPDQMMSAQDLMDMLDQLEQAMRNGMEEMARQMLQQLQQMLENLQMAQPGQMQQGQGQGDQAMRELQDMIGRQQGLADRSFDALREGQQGQRGQQPGQQGQQGQQGQGGMGQGTQPGQGQGQGQGRGDGQGGQQFGQGQPQPGQGGQPGGTDLGAIARDQEALRRMLEDLRRGLPGEGGGEALGRAEERMGSARDALEQGDADGALQDQVEALDALREGAQELAQQMQQPGQSQQAGRDGRSGDVRDEDPFGRPTATDGPLDGDSVEVPDAEVMKRARELMDEIRRRAGERTRPPAELDYLERLLDRF
jgi:uncharacterized protein (TIGR02302 family)